MTATQLIWIIVAIVVVLVILGLVLYFGRQKQGEVRRSRAQELRRSAQADALDAKDVEATAARADADAQRAEVDAQRLRMEAGGRHEQADTVRARSEEQTREAQRLDPDVDERADDYDGSARLAADGRVVRDDGRPAGEAAHRKDDVRSRDDPRRP